MPRRSAQKQQASPLPADLDDWEPEVSLARRVARWLYAWTARVLRALAVAVVVSAAASLAQDRWSLSKARRALAAAEALEDIDQARDSFNDALRRFQWSGVKEGSPAARDALAHIAAPVKRRFLGARRARTFV